MTERPTYIGTEQTAQIGDLVRIKTGFRGGNDEYVNKLAVVAYTYQSECGGDERSADQLGLKFECGQGSSWWAASSAEFIEHNRLDLIDTWQAKRKAKLRRLKNYNYISKFCIGLGYDKLRHLPDPCVTFLWEQICPGKSIWGSRGEGFAAVMNYHAVNLFFLRACESFGEPVTKKNVKQFRVHLVKWFNTLRIIRQEQQDAQADSQK